MAKSVKKLGKKAFGGLGLKDIRKNPLSASMRGVTNPMRLTAGTMPRGLGGSSLEKLANAGERVDKGFQKGPKNWVDMPTVDTSAEEAAATEERRKRAALQRLLAGNRNLLRTAGGGNANLGVGS